MIREYYQVELVSNNYREGYTDLSEALKSFSRFKKGAARITKVFNFTELLESLQDTAGVKDSVDSIPF